MVDSVIVSDEIESRIDKENLFGQDSGKRIPVTIHLPDANFPADLFRFTSSGDLLELEFQVNVVDHTIPILKKSVQKIVIGSKKENCIVYDNPEIESVSLFVEEDMYICKIIMNN
tara:strand:+ start:265 stop:609 length:345 start_codon:yes stop_codon:yes gene_type:complete